MLPENKPSTFNMLKSYKELVQFIRINTTNIMLCKRCFTMTIRKANIIKCQKWWTLFFFFCKAHTCSLARPASSQQHHVTASLHFADEWLQQCLPADCEIDVDQHADAVEHDQGHTLIHSQETCRNAQNTANYCTGCHWEGVGGEDSKLYY